MKSFAERYQRTLAGPVDVTGVGIVTGAKVRVRFRPAPVGHGVVFVRGDRPGSPRIPARTAAVTDTRRRTTLGTDRDGVTLVEHVLAALAGLRVDNCTIEIDGPEPPGLDGSAWGFVQPLLSMGFVLQSGRRPIRSVKKPIVLQRDGSCLAIYPATDSTLRVSYHLDYGALSPIVPSVATVEIRPETFTRELANCRTFLLESEVEVLKSQGIGRHLTPADVLVFGPRGVKDNRLRFADEPARHKILDLVGDLALCGFDLAGHVVAYRSGHALNVELAKCLAGQEADATEPVVLPFPARRLAA